MSKKVQKKKKIQVNSYLRLSKISNLDYLRQNAISKTLYNKDLIRKIKEGEFESSILLENYEGLYRIYKPKYKEIPVSDEDDNDSYNEDETEDEKKIEREQWIEENYRLFMALEEAKFGNKVDNARKSMLIKGVRSKLMKELPKKSRIKNKKSSYDNNEDSSTRIKRKIVKLLSTKKRSYKRQVFGGKGLFLISSFGSFRFSAPASRPNFNLIVPGFKTFNKPFINSFNKVLFYLNEFSNKLSHFKVFLMLLRPILGHFSCIYNGVQGYIDSENLTQFLWGQSKEGVLLPFYNKDVLLNKKVLYRVPAVSVCSQFTPAVLKKQRQKKGKVFQISTSVENKLSFFFKIKHYKNVRSF